VPWELTSTNGNKLGITSKANETIRTPQCLLSF